MSRKRGETSVIHGRVDPVSTTRNLLRGRADLLCEWEDFTENHSLNRVLKTAAGIARRQWKLDPRTELAFGVVGVRLGLRKSLNDLVEIGEARRGDERSSVERNTAHYEPAYTLAREILRRVSQSLASADAPVWSFLIPTPDLVEEGIRLSLAARLGTGRVEKKGRHDGAPLVMTPDILIDGGTIVADVKYKF